MKKFSYLLIILIITKILIFNNLAYSQNAKSIIDRYFEAIGGRENCQKIISRYDSMYSISRVNFLDANNLEMKGYWGSIYRLRPYYYKSYHYMFDKPQPLLCYNGKSFYYIQLGNPIRMPDSTQIDFEKTYSLGHFDEILHSKKMTYFGQDTVNNEVCDILKIHHKGGKIYDDLFYFERKTGLIIKTRKTNTQAYILFGNYQKAGNILLPHFSESRNQKHQPLVKFEIQLIKLNEPIPSDFFQLK
jgi:hypothetical protein